MRAVAEVENLIHELITPLDSAKDCEVVGLLEAGGRILAKPVSSSLDFPHWDNSAMDGYAVRYEDVQAATPSVPVALRVVEEIAAGVCPQRPVATGQAARIFTGAMLPTGADTIVVQEKTQCQGDRVLVLEAPSPAAFVRRRGAFYKAGQTLLEPGISLSAPDLAVLAAVQYPLVPVYRKPRVAILSTGDELVEPDQCLEPGQIVDSNRYALASLVQQSGGVPICLGIVPDQPEALRAKIREAIAQADLVISTGGVSVGDYDYVDTILQELGGQLHICAVAIRPGKPLTIATLPHPGGANKILYFGLPGNPASALVCFWRFVQPALRHLGGLRGGWQPRFILAQSRQSLQADSTREAYFWGQLYLSERGCEFDPASGGNNSGNLINLTQTTGLARLPAGGMGVEEGGYLDVLPIYT